MPRPDNVNSQHIQQEVRERLEAQGYQPHMPTRSAGQVVDTIVWETLAVLGEWELVELTREDE